MKPEEELGTMNWTRKPPTKTGHYWALHKAFSEDHHVFDVVWVENAGVEVDIVLIWLPAVDEPFRLKEGSIFKDAQWYGPIEPPEGWVK